MTNTPKNNYLYHQILYQFFPLPFFIQSIHAISNKIHEQHKNDNSKNMIWYIAGSHFKIWVGGGLSIISESYSIRTVYYAKYLIFAGSICFLWSGRFWLGLLHCVRQVFPVSVSIGRHCPISGSTGHLQLKCT